jgi:hypothetical protein
MIPMSLDRPPLNPTNELGANPSPVRNFPMLILRLIFIAVAAGVATLFVRSNNQGMDPLPHLWGRDPFGSFGDCD